MLNDILEFLLRVFVETALIIIVLITLIIVLWLFPFVCIGACIIYTIWRIVSFFEKRRVKKILMAKVDKLKETSVKNDS